ncbi:hypothetical protein B7486_61885, partial [cyanobacterium TDX16]
MVDLAGSEEVVAAFRSALGDLAEVCVTLESGDLLARHAVALVGLSGSIDRFVAGARLLAVQRVLESKAWRDEGARSPQHWVAGQLGVPVGQAARIVATAERVRNQPKTEEALRRGDLSDHEADAVSGATEADPEAEEEHLATATGRPADGPAPDGPGSGSGGPGAGPGGPGAGPGGPGAGSGPGSGSGWGGGPTGGARPGPGGPFGGRPSGGGGPRASLEELRRQRERARAKADADARAREERLHRERSAQKGTTEAGGWQMSMRTTKTAGLRFDRAWQVAMDQIKAQRRAEGLAPLTFGQLAA